ncbi:NmrA-like family protein [Camillea tinctor]|nr:NmrA-like family protein [Camillea tinctor]
MPPKKIITVFGATGAQGGGVVSTFLEDAALKDEWTVRAVTRDVSKESAKKLSSRGAEVVSADLNDEESLIAVLAGSYAVYGVTNYWEKTDADLEVQQGKNLANAVKKSSVSHYIWSSLLNITELSKGKLCNVYHFDSKAKVEDYVRSLEIPATYFMPGFYMTGVPGAMFGPQPPDNAWTFSLPASPEAILPMYHPGDTGKYVKAIVNNRDKLLGKRFYGATAYMTAQEVVDTFKTVFPEAGKTARFFSVPEEAFRGAMKAQGTPDFIVSELYENVKLFEGPGYYGGESLGETHKLVTDRLTTWAEYAKDAEAFKGLE